MDQTIIQFVGICLFTTRVLNGPAIEHVADSAKIQPRFEQVVIMPLIPTIANRRRGNLERLRNHGETEPHTALIAFKSCDLLSVNGWAIQKLDDNGFVYIELNRELITVVADGANPRVTPTPAKLSHVGGTLTAPFRPPAYSGAAAVFTISNGTLTTCAKARGDGAAPRIDTTLTLNAESKVTFAAGPKSVTLRPGAMIFAANVPIDFARTHRGAAGRHYEVYCEMTGATDCSLLKAALMTATTDTLCGDEGFRTTGGFRNIDATPTPDMLVDFACSNTQWP